jgi:hypothetical protein
MEERDMVCSTCKRVDFLGALKDDKALLVIVGAFLLVLAGLLLLAFG